VPNGHDTPDPIRWNRSPSYHPTTQLTRPDIPQTEPWPAVFSQPTQAAE
jgi:hypothetical protein